MSIRIEFRLGEQQDYRRPGRRPACFLDVGAGVLGGEAATEAPEKRQGAVDSGPEDETNDYVLDAGGPGGRNLFFALK